MDSRRMCAHCRAFITIKDRVCPYCHEQVGQRAVDRMNSGSLLGGLIPSARFITTLILLIDFGLYIATAIYSMRSSHGEMGMNIDMQTLVFFGAKVPPDLLRRLGLD